MQGKGLSLRLSLVALVVVLVFGTLGGFSLARDAFDADYNDCPAATRLDSVGGLAIDRTDEEDEIRVSWDALDTADLSSLGPNGYRARLTVIVDGEDARNVALGDTSLVIRDIDFAEDLTVSVAITLSDYVISDIAEAEFTSGLPAPRFSSDIRVSANRMVLTNPTDAGTLTDSDGGIGAAAAGRADKAADKAEFDLRVAVTSATGTELAGARRGILSDAGEERSVALTAVTGVRDGETAPEVDVINEARLKALNAAVVKDDGPAEKSVGGLKDLGTFYYLGFNDLFDNWYVQPGGVAQKPLSPRFRVGLQHGASGVNADDADFENYRIVIEDSNGDLLGYQAETVSASRTYGGHKIVISKIGATVPDDAEGLVAVSPLLEGDWASAGLFTNIRLSNRVTDTGAVSPYFGKITEAEDRAAGMRDDLSFGNVGVVRAGTATTAAAFPVFNALYADSPVEYFDFPSDVFEADGSYTLKAWAEDDDGTRISPQASIILGAQEREPARAPLAGVGSYVGGVRSFDATTTGNTLTVYGFSIQDE